MLENKLNIENIYDLLKEEERITKIKTYEIYEKNLLANYKKGDFALLSYIHKYLFSDIYFFAGKIRDKNISKNNFRFASVIYLDEIIKKLEIMKEDTLEEIVEKYIEFNVAHPFLEGNGRSLRVWLDHVLKIKLNKVIDWSKISKTDYLYAMEKSVINSKDIYTLLKSALQDACCNREVYIKGIDASYNYEDMNCYKLEDLIK